MNPLANTLTRALLLIAIIGLYACDSGTETASISKPATSPVESSKAADLIAVNEPWIRATAPGQTVTGVFLTLTNSSETAYALISASFNGAGAVEIHETSMDGGVMRMRKVSHVDIPANGFAELKPGSFHIMLIDLEKELQPGTSELLTLTFSDESQKDVAVTVGSPSE